MLLFNIDNLGQSTKKQEKKLTRLVEKGKIVLIINSGSVYFLLFPFFFLSSKTKRKKIFDFLFIVALLEVNEIPR